jgi:hypothetical protein
VLLLVVPVAVVRELSIQKAMERFSRAGNSPTILVTGAGFALDSNELSLRPFRAKLGGDSLTLRDIHIVVAGPMHREERNIRPCKLGRPCGASVTGEPVSS